MAEATVAARNQIEESFGGMLEGFKVAAQGVNDNAEKISDIY